MCNCLCLRITWCSRAFSIRGPFDLVMRLHQVQMIGDLVLHDIHIAGKHIIKAGVYGISRVNNLGGMMKG